MTVGGRSNLGHSVTFVDRCFEYNNVAVKGSKRNAFDMTKSPEGKYAHLE